MFKSLLAFYNGLNISNKLRFIGIMSAVISGMVIISLFYIFQYITEREMTVKESHVFANILAENIAPSMLTKDLLSIGNVLASVEFNDKITQTFALDRSWKIVGAFHKGNNFSQQRHIVSLIRENQNLWKNGYFYSVVPIKKDSLELGYLVVIASLDDFYIRMLQHGIIIILILIAAIFTTSRPRKTLLKSILEPIAILDKITTKIIETKNLDIAIHVYNNDEIGDLANNFKHMLKELNEQREVLSYQANYDALTDLPNRALFYDRISQSIFRANRNKSYVALFFIDLDQFKEVNDKFGHEYGDKLLQEVAKRLQSLLREEDTLARLGGDEFVIIMNDLKEYYDASVLAQKVLDIFNIPVQVEREELFVSCSIGISLYPQDGKDTHELLRQADVAMYRSKSEGRNRYNFYVLEMTNNLLKHVEMQSKIRKALEEKEFIVYYQPQYDMLNDELVGLEALVRWQSKEDGLIFPDAFIPFAESFGMVVGINRQVMHMAMIQAKKWHDEKLYFGRISINISIEQLEDENYIFFVKELVSLTGCLPQWLMFELVEGQFIQNNGTVVSMLEKLNSLGILIAIDDFGTGYSSLSYLKHLPIDELKIDRSFVQDIPHDKDDVAIVEAIIAIAKSLKINIIAEGVETEEQRDFLLEKGCRYVQGYLYGRPMDIESITKRLPMLQES